MPVTLETKYVSTERPYSPCRPRHTAYDVFRYISLLHRALCICMHTHTRTHACMQTLAHRVLSSVSSVALPAALVASVDAALRQRKVLNARLAEEVSVPQLHD